MEIFFTIVTIIVLLILWIMFGIGICFIIDMIHDIRFDKRRGNKEGKKLDIQILAMAVIGTVCYVGLIIWGFSILL